MKQDLFDKFDDRQKIATFDLMRVICDLGEEILSKRPAQDFVVTAKTIHDIRTLLPIINEKDKLSAVINNLASDLSNPKNIILSPSKDLEEEEYLIEMMPEETDATDQEK